MRLDKFLALKGVCSRSEVAKLLKQIDVLVNDKIVTKKDHKLIVGDTITVDEVTFEYQENLYFIMNKPKDVVSATKDDLHETVLELLYMEDYQTDLFPVGRLDIDTTGLLIITNDGQFAHELINPKKKIDKVYEVIIDHSLSDDDINELENGVIIHEDYLTKPAIVEVVNDDKIYLTISEGKYHQVKEMLKAVGNEVLELKRIKIGNFELDTDLECGEYKEMKKEELLNLIKK